MKRANTDPTGKAEVREGPSIRARGRAGTRRSTATRYSESSMKQILTSVALPVLLLLAGCESTDSFAERVRNRFSAVPPQVQVFDGDTRTVYFAAQLAFKRLDYTLVRSNIGSLRVEAASRINTSAAFRDARQLLAEVDIAQVGPTQSEVSLRLTEAMEGQGLGAANELPLRDHGFYGTYFAVLEQVLREQAEAAKAQKN